MARERALLFGAIEGMSEEQAATHPPDARDGEEGWCLKEQLAHLANMETSYRKWSERALHEDRPDLSRGTQPDRPAYAVEEAHDHTVAEHVEEMKHQRQLTLALMDTLQPEQYDRTATSQVWGELTVLQYLRSYYRHDRMHQAQIQGRVSDYQPNFVGGEEPDQRRG